ARIRRPSLRHQPLRPGQRAPRGTRRAMTAVADLRRGRLAGLTDNERWLWRFMLAPAILYIVLLVGFPFLLSLYYSLSDATVASRALNFTGLENFRRVIDSGTFWLALRNTLLITLVSQLVILILANILAAALIADFPGKWIVRLLILLPWVAP